jgi:sulfite exporter TauE/SafE
MDYMAFFTAFSIGLLGGAHCLGMCGGIMGALTMALDASQYYRRLCLILAYNLGRISSYVAIAVVFYWLVDSVNRYFSSGMMRVVAGIFLLMMGLYLADWWRGLLYLEKIGGILWKKIQPLSKALLPVKSVWQALLLGALWGWLPCGLIYSALVYSATATSMTNAGLIMLSFALGTLPAVLMGGLMAERLIQYLRQKNIRIVMALLIMTFGIWTLATAYQHLSHGDKHSLHSH